jgi:hypothetical protein
VGIQKNANYLEASLFWKESSWPGAVADVVCPCWGFVLRWSSAFRSHERGTSTFLATGAAFCDFRVYGSFLACPMGTTLGPRVVRLCLWCARAAHAPGMYIRLGHGLLTARE